MVRRKAIGGLLLLALALATTSAIAAWQMQAKQSDLARARMAGLKAKAKGKKTGLIMFNQFLFVYGKPQLVDHITNSKQALAGLTTPEHARLRDRILWLRNIPPAIQTGGNEITVITDLRSQKVAAPSCIIGVEAFKVKQPDGSVKYFAIAPESASSLAIYDSFASKSPQKMYQTYSRSDFVNPEDIDWFFGVKDFSTYTHE